MDDQKKNKILAIKRFGYVLSALLLIMSNISYVNEWSFTPLLVLITMYFLTGALWGPALVKPFYEIFGKYIIKPTGSSNPKIDEIISRFAEVNKSLEVILREGDAYDFCYSTDEINRYYWIPVGDAF